MLRNILIFIVFFSFAIYAHAKILDKIVAIVNGEVITLYDLKKEIKKTSLAQGLNISLNNKEVVKQFLSDMINKMLFKEEADKLGIKVSKYEVENQLKQIIKSSELTEQEFENELKKEGLTIEEIKKSIEDNIKINKLISYMVRSKVVVTDEDIKKYFEDHNMKLKQKEIANLILFQSENKEVLKKIVVKSGEKLQAPPGVKTMDLGEVDVDALQQNWKNALKGVKKGQLTPIFEVNSKYFRVYVKEKKLVNPLADDKIHQIKNKIYAEKLKKRYIEYISKLRSKAVIEIRM